MRTINKFVVLSLMLMFGLPQASAHHSWAAIFDVDGDTEIDGVVSKILWRNPHIQLQITTEQGTAEEKVYEIESNSVASLTRMGVSKELLAVGTQVKIAGYPSRDGSYQVFMNHLMLPDETELIFLRNAEPRWEGNTIGTSDVLAGKVVEEEFSKRPTSIFGVWNTIYGAEGSHRAIGRAVPVEWTEHALAFQKQQEEAGIQERPDRHDCSPRDIIGAMGAPYPIEVIDNGDTIAINAEYFDTYRTINMKSSDGAPEIQKDGIGYSTGLWVADTLVVNTVMYREGGVEGDDTLTVNETFTLSADHNRLLYTRAIIDPLMRATPTIAKRWWQYIPGAFVQPYDCSAS